MTLEERIRDSYHCLMQAKKLLAIAQAAIPADDEDLTDPNRSRLERAKLLVLDAVTSINAALESQ